VNQLPQSIGRGYAHRYSIEKTIRHEFLSDRMGEVRQWRIKFFYDYLVFYIVILIEHRRFVGCVTLRGNTPRPGNHLGLL
jgi:hypothetical protein